VPHSRQTDKPKPTPSAETPRPLDVLVVGAGFSGVAIGVELRRAGIDSFLILDRGEGPGGTWRDNRYPGAACDVASHLYSFSFEPNPDWSRHFSPQAEIRAYLQHCIDKYQLAPHVACRREVTQARFDAVANGWRVRTRDGTEYLSRALVLANGPLSNPALPDIPGLDRFGGECFHTARWPAGWSAAGKAVAVIGTGASAIQVVPEVAGAARSLKVFQRTPPWIVPRHDGPIPPALRRSFARHPWLHRAYRNWLYCRYEARALGFTVHQSLMAPARWIALAHLRRQVHDRDLRRRLTPGYPIGCKRILLSDDYYPALQRDDVSLVTTGIRQISPQGVVTEDGEEHAADTIVLATGFAATEYLATLDIRGPGDRALGMPGEPLPSTYLGITVPGFPNLFLLMGPNTGLGHNSMIFMIEAQARYVRQALETLLAGEFGRLEVREDVARAFQGRIEGRLARSVWNSGCSSWYLKDGRNPVIWPGTTVEYWWRTRRLHPGDFTRH